MGVIGRARDVLDVALHGDSRYTSGRPVCVCDAGERFSGMRVVVTGGSGAIGSAVCMRFAMGGAEVLAAGRSHSAYERAFHDGGVGFLELDVTDEASVEKAFSLLDGKLDVLVNCAGGSARGGAKPLREQSIETVDRMLEVNLRGSLLCSRAACRIMADARKGCIVNVSSVIGLRGKANFAEYGAAKAGISGYTRSLALEMGPYGVRVNCVSPGFIQRGTFGEKTRQYNVSSNCLGAVGCAEDVAGAVAFLASDEAAFITGQDLCVDGGRSLGLMGDSVWE